MQLQKILIAVDGSEHSKRAVEYAIELLKMLQAEIILIHCHKNYPTLLGEPYLQQAINKINQEAETLVKPFRELFREGNITITERIMEGRAGEVIVEVANTEKIDLIIMGSRGLSDLEGLIVGSVTHRVLHAASCPVLVVR